MYILIKPRTRNVVSLDYGTLDSVVIDGDWLPFKTFDDAYEYLKTELDADPRYFIFEWVGTEYGKITKYKVEETE